MKKVFVLFGALLGVLTFFKVETSQKVKAQSQAKHSILTDFCPDAGESCVRFPTVVIRPQQ